MGRHTAPEVAYRPTRAEQRAHASAVRTGSGRETTSGGDLVRESPRRAAQAALRRFEETARLAAEAAASEQTVTTEQANTTERRAASGRAHASEQTATTEQTAVEADTVTQSPAETISPQVADDHTPTHTPTDDSAPRAAHTATRRSSGAAARRSTRTKRTTAPRIRRSVVGTAAAVAIVAMTTTASGAALLTNRSSAGTTPTADPHTHPSGGPAVAAATPTKAAGVASGAAAPVVDDATLSAASEELVRADFLTQETAATLAPEQLAQIEATRAKLGEAVAANAPSVAATEALAARDTGTVSRAAVRGEVPSPHEAAASGTNGVLPAAEDGAADGADPTADPATDPAAEDTSTQEIATLTAELRVLLDASQETAAIQVVPGPPTQEEIQAQLDEWASSTAGYGNGQLPESVMCTPDFAPGARFRCDATHQLEALNAEFRAAFGRNLSITDSYRSYGSQVAVKASRGYLAAVPGTSNHGWGLAVDLGGGVNSYGTAEYQWMRDNAPDFGWDNPTWARPGGNKNEPWHWEYGTSQS